MDHKRVNLRPGSVQICLEYQRSNGVCRNPRCCDLHICSAYLAGCCQKSDCPYCHCCIAVQNQSVITKMRLEDIQCEENMRQIFNSAFPKICIEYQKREGCQKGDKCPYLHICGSFAKGWCRSGCEMSHEFDSGRNMNILRSFGIGSSEGSKCLANALLADGFRGRNVILCGCRKLNTAVGSVDNLALGMPDGGKQNLRSGHGGGGRGNQRGTMPRKMYAATGSVDNLASDMQGRSMENRGRGGRGRGRGGRDAISCGRGVQGADSNIDGSGAHHLPRPDGRGGSNVGGLRRDQGRGGRGHARGQRGKKQNSDGRERSETPSQDETISEGGSKGSAARRRRRGGRRKKSGTAGGQMNAGGEDDSSGGDEDLYQSGGEEPMKDEEDLVAQKIKGYLCRKGGRVDFLDVRSDKELLKDLPFQLNLVEWISEHSKDFVIMKGKQNEIKSIAPCFHLGICGAHNSSPTGCQREDDRRCPYLHICKDFIAGVCKGPCNKNHHFQHGGTRVLLTGHKLHLLKSEMCRKAIASSLPQICADYNRGGCSQADTCHKLHVCQSSLLEKDGCKKKNCLNHDVRNKICIEILRQYHLHEAKKSTLVCNVLPAFSAEGAASEQKECDMQRRDSGCAGRVKQPAADDHGDKGQLKPATRNKKETSKKAVPHAKECSEICEPNVRDACKAKDCPNLHYNLPYLWQYSFDGKWENFDESYNIRIEEEFCQVNSGSYRCTLDAETSKRVSFPFSGRTDIIFDKQKMVSQASSNLDEMIQLPVRRLSTLSYCNAEAYKTSATAWRWYFYMNDEWCCQEERHSDDEVQVEKHFNIGEPSFEFSDDDGNKLRVNFNSTPMVLVNVESELSIDVRRRPEFISPAEVEEKKKSSTAKIKLRPTYQFGGPNPKYWHAMGETELMVVDLEPDEIRSGVERSFMYSMHDSAEIVSVKLVQNARLWEGYLSKKELLETSPDKNVKEIFCFYISDPNLEDFVDKFGVATVDIEGARSIPNLGSSSGLYFSCNARKLHEVSEGKVKARIFTMYWCRVLIGSSKMGKVTDSYDEVVYDTFMDPDCSTIMKLDPEQCYPEFKISYKVSCAQASRLYHCDAPPVDIHDRPPPYTPMDSPPPYQLPQANDKSTASDKGIAAPTTRPKPARQGLYPELPREHCRESDFLEFAPQPHQELYTPSRLDPQRQYGPPRPRSRPPRFRPSTSQSTAAFVHSSISGGNNTGHHKDSCCIQ